MKNIPEILTLLTIVWAVYLALTLWLTIFMITLIVDGWIADFLNKGRVIMHTIDRDLVPYIIILVCILWSIWYFYFIL